MKVCHFAASRGLGRGEVYVDLVNRMASKRDDLEIALLAPYDALFRGRLDERVQFLGYKAKDNRNNPLFWLECASLLRRLNPQLVHTHFAKATAIYRRIKPAVGVPYVATKHNPRKGRIYEKVSNVIAVADVVKQSIGHGRVSVIHNGIVPAQIERAPREPGTPLRLLAVGRLDPIKAYDKLIRALDEYDQPWTLDLVGEGEHRDKLEAVVQQLGLQDKVTLPGFDDNIPARMAACDAFLMSSFSEGCSVALLEAMHYAPLVLSTPVGLAPELFPDWLLWDHDKPASLAPLFNAYDALRQRYADWSAGILPQFHMDACVEKHVDLYQDLVRA
ncbi:MAG: glycosyltransferase [Phycisphaeraceae bacterium]|nr:glycosyltransferase [Phycisphaeraceae bacterium]